MPLTSHKRSVTRESPSGSAHSSPSRSPDPHGHHQAHQPTATHTTNPGDHPTGLTHSVGVEHSSSSASLTHSHAERDRHVPQERPSSSLSSGSNSSTGSGGGGGGGRSAVSMAGSSHGHGRSVPPVWGEKVVLLVDGKRFTMNPKLFMSHPNTMLGRWVHIQYRQRLCTDVSVPSCVTRNGHGLDPRPLWLHEEVSWGEKPYLEVSQVLECRRRC